MSTFEGKLLEDSLDFIRIDQFERKNHDGTTFFLSHFHTDHFKGIFDEAFLKVLVENEDKVLYCTAVTKNLLLRHIRCKIPNHKIFPLIMNAPYVLKHKDRPSVQVTAVPAGHCPGSAMFLFEQDVVRVLYTGDFRIDPSELHKFVALHHKDETVKKINTLYLDTTFCSRKWISFPTRKQTEVDLINIAQDWLSSNPDHQVGILYNSYYGLEPLLMKLASSLKTRINVLDRQSYINYSCIPELHPALCQTETDSRIHLCPVKEKEYCKVCLRNRDVTKTIKPCAQSFDNDQLQLGRQKEGGNGLVRLAYSMHCSLEELIGVVQYLKPDLIHPCALPKNVTAKEVLESLFVDVKKLKQQQQENKENLQSRSSSPPPSKKFRLFQTSEAEEEDGEEPVIPEKKLEPLILSSSDEGEEKPLSQNSIDSPPL